MLLRLLGITALILLSLFASPVWSGENAPLKISEAEITFFDCAVSGSDGLGLNLRQDTTFLNPSPEILKTLGVESDYVVLAKRFYNSARRTLIISTNRRDNERAAVTTSWRLTPDGTGDYTSENEWTAVNGTFVANLKSIGDFLKLLHTVFTTKEVNAIINKPLAGCEPEQVLLFPLP